MSSLFSKPTQPQNQEPPPGNGLFGPHPSRSVFNGVPQPPASIFSAAPCVKSEFNGTLGPAPTNYATQIPSPFGRPPSSEQTKPFQGFRKHALDTTNELDIMASSPPKKAKMPTVTTSHLFDQVERLVELHRKVPVRFQAAVAKVIDLKLLFLRSNTKPNPACEDDGMLEELERSTKIKSKLVEGGIESQNIELLIEDKVRSLLILNGLFDVLASL
ncbi:MAG: hypothetical protein Q9208_005238 [Pyrenodesmia sp. 3 TL-2023]